MNSRETPERYSSYWKNLIVEPTKHQEIEQRCDFLNWTVTAPNIFLVLVLFMSFIAPSSCTDHKALIDAADVKTLCGASEPDVALTYSALYKCCSDHGGLSSALSPLQTETAKPDNETKGSEPQQVDQVTDDTTTESAQEAFEYWVEHNSLGGEIANKLGAEKKDIKIDDAKELLASLEPPPPPSDTVERYNPWLDKPRPTTIEEYLRNFEVIFVVDDSGSMMKEERWKETRDALATIAQKTFELKVDTVSLRFLNDATDVLGLKGKNKLMSLFDAVQPNGRTPLGRALRAVFKKHLNRIDTAVENGGEEYSKIPPLDIIVLTDGVPSDKGEDKPREVIAKAVKRLNDNHYHPNTMSVQIVQIANEDKAKKVLRDLVVGDNGRIVDTVPYAGVMDSEKLLRILLGGVHPNIRSQLPVAMLAFEQQRERA